MAPKGGNSKKEAGRARKAENEAKKQDAVNKVKEGKEAETWKQGAKGTSKADMEAAKRAEAAAKKAEREALLAAEEASAPSKVKAAPKAGNKKKNDTFAPKKANAGVAAFRTDDPLGLRRDEDRVVPELSAVGIDQMLDALDLVNEKTDAATVGQKAAGIETHPERRFKAALKAFVEREMPRIKEEHPGLRKNQYEERLFLEFKKSPDNPFNQQTLAYNASKSEKVDALEKHRKEREEKYRVDN